MTTNREKGPEGQSKINNPWENIKEPKELLSFLNRYIGALITENGKERIMGVMPHMIMSHGFMSWQRILRENGTFKTDMKKTREERDRIEKSLFDSFSGELFEQPKFSVFTPEERKKLAEEGWQTYLED
jgi:hypothetical protein